MKKEPKEGLDFLNLVVLALTIYVVGALLIELLFELPEETKHLLYYIDVGICIFFFFEFAVRFTAAKNKLNFMRWGWIDLIASIPMFKILRLGRLYRFFHVAKRVQTPKEIISTRYGNRAKGSLEVATLLAIFIIIFSSIAILQVETSPESNIKTAEDAIWWAFVTISTVGYGDKYPVTSAGRMIAVFLMTAGVGVFGLFTAYIASIFVADDKRKQEISASEGENKPQQEEKTET